MARSRGPGSSVVAAWPTYGTAYVGRDNALWLVDDNAGRIYVVNPSTGVLKRVIGSRTLADVRRYRGTRRDGTLRSRDLESAAYDAARDRMYVFVGNDCRPSADNCRVRSRPTAFRFRQGLRPAQTALLPAAGGRHRSRSGGMAPRQPSRCTSEQHAPSALTRSPGTARARRSRSRVCTRSGAWTSTPGGPRCSSPTTTPDSVASTGRRSRRPWVATGPVGLQGA
jgi:hypothetical protein